MKAIWLILFTSFCLIKPSWATVLNESIGYRVENNGIRVEFQFGEVAPDDVEAAQSELAVMLANEYAQNPQASMEYGWIDTPESFRGPAANGLLTRARAFAEGIKNRLSEKGIEPQGSASIAEGQRVTFKDRLSNFYYDHSKVVWTVGRVTTSTGLRIATIYFTSLNLFQSVTISLAVAAACTLTAYLYKWIVWVNNDFRVTDKVSNKIHGKINYGIMETTFSALVVGGEAALRAAVGAPQDLPGLWGFVKSVGLVLASQQVADRAIGKYLKLLNLDPSISAKVKDANFYKRGAIASILSVLTFTALNTSDPVITVLGWAAFGTLTAGSLIYEKRVDRQLARAIERVPCNSVLGGSENFGPE